MPINYHDYPANWREIRARILARAGNRCEKCGAANGEPNPITGSRVVLTVHHLDHDTANNDHGNLQALCQLCHNLADGQYRAFNRRYGKGTRSENYSLFSQACEATESVHQQPAKNEVPS